MSCFKLTVLNKQLTLTFSERVYNISVLHKPISISVSCFALNVSGIFDDSFDDSFE